MEIAASDKERHDKLAVRVGDIEDRLDALEVQVLPKLSLTDWRTYKETIQSLRSARGRS